MRLNRSSYWTNTTGEKFRVKHMTIGEIQSAIIQIDQIEMQQIGDDPYIVQQFCKCSDFCSVLPEPETKKDGFLLEDWCELFRSEIKKRVKLLKSETIKLVPKENKTNFLVKWFKFW